MRPLLLQDVLIRLVVSLVIGCALGYGRTRLGRVAGMRTYTITSLGACLAMIIGQYEFQMLNTIWFDPAIADSMKFDASRYVAMVVSGVGFLSAGTIVSIGRNSVVGLTTATGLFAASCLGIASGAGFWSAVIVVAIPMILTIDYSYSVETGFKRFLRNMKMYVTCQDNSMTTLATVLTFLEDKGTKILESDTDDSSTFIVSVKLGKNMKSHSVLLAQLADLDCVESVQEIFS
jgi:putative Mg2+ transporter-C (MgtC) family protein